MAALLLMVPSLGAEGFELAYLGLYVVGFEVEMHAHLGGLGVAGSLEKDSHVGVG